MVGDLVLKRYGQQPEARKIKTCHKTFTEAFALSLHIMLPFCFYCFTGKCCILLLF